MIQLPFKNYQEDSQSYPSILNRRLHFRFGNLIF